MLCVLHVTVGNESFGCNSKISEHGIGRIKQCREDLVTGTVV